MFSRAPWLDFVFGEVWTSTVGGGLGDLSLVRVSITAEDSELQQPRQSTAAME